MKKTSLFSIALLFSSILVAQTSIQNSGAANGSTSIQSNKSGAQSNSTANASSQTNLLSDAVSKAKSKTSTEIEKENKAAVANKNKAQAALSAEENKSMKSQDLSAQSGSDINVSAKGNNTNNNTSIKGGSTLPISPSKTDAHQIMDKGEAVVITKSNPTVEGGQKMAINVNRSTVKAENKGKAFASTTLHAGATSATTIKPHPVSIKTNTMMKTNGGIQIR
jgi:hypothetical protein